MNNFLLVTCFQISVAGGSDARSRVTAFCPSRPGLNFGTDLGFFHFRIADNLFLLGIGLFLK